MAMNDWRCATPGCNHLEYQHSGFAGKGTCKVVTDSRPSKKKSKNDKGHAGSLCPCTKFKAQEHMRVLMG